MKKVLCSLATLTLLYACNNAPEADKAKTGEKETVTTTDGVPFSTDSTSTVTWTGTKPTGAHTGSLKVKEGSLTVKDDNLTGGSFVIDMNSLNVTDLTAETGKDKLEGHLKSGDFFDVAKYATAKFEITGVEVFKYDSLTMKNVLMKDATHTIKGNFTLRDSTKNISFPAKVTIVDNKINAIADFNIDRTQWGLSYKGPNNPQDWVISKTVNLKLNIGATKK